MLERKAAATAPGSPRGATRAHADAAALDARPRRGARAPRATLERLRLALDAHDPQRTLERGYALVEDGAGAPITSAEARAPRARLDAPDGRRRAAGPAGGGERHGAVSDPSGRRLACVARP